jgi:hypothetical protein
VAQRQLEADSLKREESDGGKEIKKKEGDADNDKGDKEKGKETPLPPPMLGRFHGSVKLNPIRVGRDASKIAEEVLQHLTGLAGALVEVTLEIHADLPDGADDKLVRDVTENCRTLKFDNYGFEES